MTAPEKEEFYLLPFGSHHKEKSLDHLATQVYGRKYSAIQALDVKANDVWEVYDCRTQDDCEEYIWDHYKPLDRWLNMKLGDDISQPWDNGEDIAKYEFQIEREAPDPGYVIADLILKGHLPFGKYLCQVSW